MRRAVLLLTAAALPFASLDGSAVQAQSIMRSPSINIGSRIPTISPVNPNIAERAVIGIDRTTPNLRTRPPCSYAYRDSNGECSDQAVSSASEGGGGPSAKNRNGGPRRTVAQFESVRRNLLARNDRVGSPVRFDGDK